MAISIVLSAADGIFSTLSNNQAQLTTLAQTSMARGTEFYSKGNYDAAARAFKTAIGLDPSTDNAPKAYDLLATAYVAQNKIDDAIKAYRASLSINPADDNAHLKLGNIYYGQKQYADAEKEYKAAVQLNPQSSTNFLSLGQAYLAEGKNDEAVSAFRQVVQMSPTDYGSHYALGQAYAKQGLSDQAITEFQKAISLKNSASEVRVDLGSLYADMGRTNDAQDQLNILSNLSSSYASKLSTYMHSVEKPKMTTAYGDGFSAGLGPGTPVYDLSPRLSSPGSSALLSIKIGFSKDMDLASIENPLNWSIKKATAGSLGGAYNWGLNSATDAQVSPVPVSVIYDETSLTATVSFVVKQNSAGSATIDPSHLIFKFMGKDTYQNSMDTSADEYSGLSKIV
jgi:tetratricopeptide (TPR) repeat protein